MHKSTLNSVIESTKNYSVCIHGEVGTCHPVLYHVFFLTIFRQQQRNKIHYMDKGIGTLKLLTLQACHMQSGRLSH